jgi:riboflavin kinase/FMN adenylyltransferase
MIRGRVVKGLREARTLGYPTANLSISPAKTKLKTGVYASWATYNGAVYQAALVIRHDPDKVEVHLIGYSGPDFYGKKIEIDPVEKVSEMENMELDALIVKIRRDIDMVKKVLEEEKLS